MPIFYYKALETKNGVQSIVTGKIKADNIKEARQKIKNLSFTPINIEEDSPYQEAADEAEKKAYLDKLKPLSLKEKINFTTTFKILSQSGVPVIESLIFIESEADSSRIRAAARVIKKQILDGATYAQTVARYPNVFGTVYIGLTKAGESSGEMEKTLGRLAELLQKEANIKGKVTGALIYPVFVILLAIVALLIMLMFVFPTFKEMFDNLGKELPIYTRICIDLGIFLKAYWPVVPFTLFSLIFGSYYSYKYPVTRRLIDITALRIPIVGELLTFANLSNFFAVMQVAYDAGIPVIDCLYLANMTIDNHVMKISIESSAKLIQQGQQLSYALKKSGVIPQMMLFLIAIGEQSGRLGEMLTQGIEYIDKELDKVIDAMTKMIEPIMLIVIGGMVMFLALALYLPLFQSYEV